MTSKIALALAVLLCLPVAFAATAPAGRLSVMVVADGELQDASIRVARAEGGEAAIGRTYTNPETNPAWCPWRTVATRPP